jgi:hypothetical protein
MTTAEAKRVYNSTLGLSMILFSPVLAIVMLVLKRQLSGTLGNIISGGIFGLTLILLRQLAQAVAKRRFYRLGFPRESRSVEIITRGTVLTADLPPIPFEIRMERSLWASLGIMSASVAVLALTLLTFVPSLPGTEPYGVALVIVCGVTSVGCLLAYRFRAGFLARVDERGVQAISRSGFRRRSALWDEINRCDVTAFRSAFGEVSYPYFVFRDLNGGVLLKIDTRAGIAVETVPFRVAVEQYLSVERV